MRWSLRTLAAVLLTVAGQAWAADAPNGPGQQDPLHWARSVKQFLGTAANPASQVYFTGADGILTEIFYPSPDTPQNVDLQLIVEDKGGTFGCDQAEEKRQTTHTVRQVDHRAMLWEVTTKANNGQWEIVNRVFSDPRRNSVIERTRFHVLQGGKTVSDYNVYLLNKPAISTACTQAVTANMNNSRTLTCGNRTMLCASKPNSTSSALATSLPWKNVGGNVMVSNGFAGINSGWSDLFGTGGSHPQTHIMQLHYDGAYNGNVAQMGWLDFGGSAATQIDFNVVISLGGSEAAAMRTASETLDSDMAALEAQYVSEWKQYAAGLKPQNDDEYYLAAMTLKSSADKATGAIVAGLGTPWGEVKGEDTKTFDGYHEVWSRDLFKFASALLAAGDTDTANEAVSFLFNSQMQDDGRFPRMSFANGLPAGESYQLDQVAFPIVLAWKLNRTDLWPRIKRAADRIAADGPYTSSERWEEVGGYSPSTIAAEIAGLVCAADLASRANDPKSAEKYLKLADSWHNNVITWTFTTKGSLVPGNTGRYFLRLNVEPGNNGQGTRPNDQNPNDGTNIASHNGAPQVKKDLMIDGGFLELVRLGVFSPNDWSIIETLPTYDNDKILKQDVAGSAAYFRYDYDGYGNKNNGDAWDGSGRGRLWPLLTAERGIYEIDRTGDGAAGGKYLKTLRAMASPEGFIPEQVYNSPVTFQNPFFDVLLPNGYKPGDSTGSMRPLSWAMGEYINLLVATQTRHSDAPEVVRKRYVIASPVKVTFNVKTANVAGQMVFLAGDSVFLGSQDTDRAIRLPSDHQTNWSQSVSLPSNTTLKFRFFSQIGDGAPVFGPMQTVSTPASGEIVVSGSLP